LFIPIVSYQHISFGAAAPTCIPHRLQPHSPSLAISAKASRAQYWIEFVAERRTTGKEASR
jgi:hypothetical protein